jgi:CelD/BcsL family acetyltransferase involved in cellulose biosynthesis
MKWDWMWAWWQAHQDLFQLLICVAEEASKVIAIAPFVIGREETGSRHSLKQLGFLAGLGEAKGERMNILIPAERVDELAPALLQQLAGVQDQWDAVRWNRLPAESAITPHLLRALERLTTGSGVLNETACRFLRLDFPSWDSVVNSRSRKWRAQHRKIKQALPSLHGVTFHSGPVSPTGEDPVEALFRLHALQFQGQDSHFLRERALRVHRDLLPRWLAAGRAELCYLVAADKIVSMVQLLREGSDFYAFQVGRDTTFEGRSVGTATWDWAIEHAFREGARSVDFLAGDFEYKRRWTAETRTVLDLEGYSPTSWRARVFRTLRWMGRKISRAHATPPGATATIPAGQSRH